MRGAPEWWRRDRRPPRALACIAVLVAVTLGACGSDDSQDSSPLTCVSGENGCTCQAGRCGPGLVCVDDLCLVALQDAGPLDAGQDGSNELDAGDSGMDGAPDGPETIDSAVDAMIDAGPVRPVDIQCGDRSVALAMRISGPINRDTTWSGAVHVTGEISVRNDAVLTLEPGTRVIVAQDARIDFGFGGTSPALRAMGTVDEPVTFCGEEEAPGYWAGLRLSESASELSELHHVLVSDGGGVGAQGAIDLQAPALLDNVQVAGALGRGIWASSFVDGSGHIVVRDGGGEAMYLSQLDTLAKPPVPLWFEGNGADAIAFDATLVEDSLNLADPGVPYRQLSDLTVEGDMVLEPGVEYELAHQRTLAATGGRFEAAGTEQNPIVIRQVDCPQPDSCDWGLDLANLSLSGGTLIHTRIENGGWSYASGSPPEDMQYLGSALQVGEGVTLEQVEIVEAQGRALRLAAPLDAESEGLILSSHHAELVSAVSLTVAQSLPQETRLEALSSQDMAQAFVVVEEPQQTQSIEVRPLGLPYQLAAGLQVQTDVEFTVLAGVDVRVGAEQSLRFGAGSTLNWVGTESAPIVFDWVAQDLFWDGLEIDAIRAESQLRHVLVRHGGTGGALVRLSGPVDMQDCTIEESVTDCLHIASGDDTDYAATNTIRYAPNGELIVVGP